MHFFYNTRQQVQYLLNQINGANASYSLRKLKSSAISAIRVSRSSDSAELDIGFTNGELDTASLLSFIGSNSGYIAKWYDQSGNGNDAAITNTAYMPRIVNAGILERDFDTTKCAATWPTFASAAGVTLISNGGFENDLTGWTLAATGWSVDTGTVYSGAKSATASGVNPTQYASFTGIAQHRYFVSCWVNIPSYTSGYLKLRLFDGSTYVGEVSVTSTTSGWQRISFIATAVNTSCRVYLTSSGTLTLYVDDVVCIDVTDYGKPTCYFDGSNDVLSIANSSSVDILAQPLLLNSVFNNAGQIGYILCKNESTSTLQYALLYENATVALPNAKSIGLILEGSSTTNVAYSNANSFPNNTQVITSGSWLSDTLQVYKNGSANGTTDTYSGSLTSRPNMNIGARSNSTDGTVRSTFFKGYLSEIIISTDPSKREKIERSQLKFYGLS